MLKSVTPYRYNTETSALWMLRGLLVGCYFGAAYGLIFFGIGGLFGAVFGASAGLGIGAAAAVASAIVRNHFRGATEACERWERISVVAIIAAVMAYSYLTNKGMAGSYIMFVGLPGFWGILHAFAAPPPVHGHIYLGEIRSDRRRNFVTVLPFLIFAVNAAVLAAFSVLR